MTSTERETNGDVQTRERLIEVAVTLFSRHSYEGTSLQMIADELGFSKGAIYHHFRTREELLHAIVAPMLERLGAIVEEAEARRTPHARAEYMLTGYAAHLAANRRVAAVLSLDPGVLKVLRANSDWNRVINRQSAVLAGVTAGPTGQIKASVVMGGLAAAVDPRVADIDDEALCDILVDTGRRTLGLRTPRRDNTALHQPRVLEHGVARAHNT
ncbi:MAG TPA: helix-turn-helix domain-containing protein [Mycobacterium sp.]|nr:helix-turn-helix domain-containing protein [Mycobacterium sp.]